jgi:hypothetical protein
MFYKNILLQTINDNINSKNNYIISEGVKEMKQKYLKQGIEQNIIDSYLERYKNIKSSKYLKDEIQINVQPNDRNNIDKFKDFHDLEVLVDYVENKINLDKQDKTLKKSYRSDNEIETDGEPVYKDSELEVWYADSPRACIKYKGDFPYSWCISNDTGINMYTTYRFKQHEPAFYFVKQLKKIDKELNENPDFPEKMLDKYHFFVIQVFKNVKIGDLDSKYYYVTSALNDGDVQMSWNDIVGKAPILKGKQEFFKDVPHSETERADYQRFKNGVSDEEFKVLSVEEKRKYLDIYVSQEKLLSDEQFLSMPKSLKKLYIGFGVPISEEQFKYIKNNSELLKYYSIVLKRRIEKSDEGMNVEFSNEEVLYAYKNQLGSIRFYGKFIKVLIDNNIELTDSIKISAVKQEGYAIYHLTDLKNGVIPSETIQLAAVQQNGETISIFTNLEKGIIPSEKVQLAAVSQNGDSIRYIDNPNEKVQMVAVNQNSESVQYIEKPTEKVSIKSLFTIYYSNKENLEKLDLLVKINKKLKNTQNYSKRVKDVFSKLMKNIHTLNSNTYNKEYSLFDKNKRIRILLKELETTSDFNITLSNLDVEEKLNKFDVLTALRLTPNIFDYTKNSTYTRPYENKQTYNYIIEIYRKVILPKKLFKILKKGNFDDVVWGMTKKEAKKIIEKDYQEIYKPLFNNMTLNKIFEKYL